MDQANNYDVKTVSVFCRRRPGGPFVNQEEEDEEERWILHPSAVVVVADNSH